MMRILVAALLAVLTGPLTALDLGPERPVSSAHHDLAPGYRTRPRVAVSEDGALAAWTDFRTGSAAIYAARMGRDGQLLDPVGVVIAEDAASGVDVIWTGQTWLVTYLATSFAGQSLQIRTLSRDGVLGPPVTVLDGNERVLDTVRMATNGTSVALVTNQGRGAILTLEGAVHTRFSFAAVKYYDYGVDVAALGDGYAIASTVEEGVEVIRVTGEGAVGPRRLLPESRGAYTLAIGSDGSSLLVAYDVPPALFTQRVDANGDATGPRQTVFTAALIPIPLMYPSIAWGGAEYLLGFAPSTVEAIEPMTVYLARDGVPIQPPSRIPATLMSSDRVDVTRRSDGSAVAIGVSDERVIEVAIFDTASAPRTIHAVSFSAPGQRDVHLAGKGSTPYIAWVESTARGGEVRLAPGAGAPSVLVATTPYPRLMDVVVDDEWIWVVWSENEGPLKARRYTASLEPIGAPVSIVPFIGNGVVRAAAGGGALLVTFTGFIIEPAVFCRIVRPEGESLVVRSLDIAVPYNAPLSAAAWNGSEFVVAWFQALADQWWQLPESVPHNLVAVRVGVDAVSRDATPLIISDEPGMTPSLLLAKPADGSVLIAWEGRRLIPRSDQGWSVSTEARTSIARFDGSERPAAHLLKETTSHKLLGIAEVANGAAVLWSTPDALEYAVLDAGLNATETGSLPVIVGDGDIGGRGAQPVVAYSRVAGEATYGRVHRVFVRTPGSRRRSAR